MIETPGTMAKAEEAVDRWPDAGPAKNLYEELEECASTSQSNPLKVFVRLKAASASAGSHRKLVWPSDDHTRAIYTTSASSQQCSLECAHVFSTDSPNTDVYRTAVAPLIGEMHTAGAESVKNALFIAYGYSGSGKSHTILGSGDMPGVLPQTMKALLSKCSPFRARALQISHRHGCSDSVLDVFGQKKVKHRELADSKEVKDEADVNYVISKLKSERIVRSTSLNDRSSRSAVLVDLVVDHRQLTFADLAGPEKAQAANPGLVNEKHYNETRAINIAASALQKCLLQIASGEKPTTRESALCKLLFGCCERVNLLVNADEAAEESRSALKEAAIAQKAGSLKVCACEANVKAEEQDYSLPQLQRLQLQLRHSQKRIRELEDQYETMQARYEKRINEKEEEISEKEQEHIRLMQEQHEEEQKERKAEEEAKDMKIARLKEELRKRECGEQVAKDRLASKDYEIERLKTELLKTQQQLNGPVSDENKTNGQKDSEREVKKPGATTEKRQPLQSLQNIDEEMQSADDACKHEQTHKHRQQRKRKSRPDETAKQTDHDNGLHTSYQQQTQSKKKRKLKPNPKPFEHWETGDEDGAIARNTRRQRRNASVV